MPVPYQVIDQEDQHGYKDEPFDNLCHFGGIDLFHEMLLFSSPSFDFCNPLAAPKHHVSFKK
jgi:hypothetical protein